MRMNHTRLDACVQSKLAIRKKTNKKPPPPFEYPMTSTRGHTITKRELFLWMRLRANISFSGAELKWEFSTTITTVVELFQA